MLINITDFKFNCHAQLTLSLQECHRSLKIASQVLKLLNDMRNTIATAKQVFMNKKNPAATRKIRYATTEKNNKM